MLCEELTAGFELFVLCFEFGEVDDTGDASAQVLGEGRVGDDVLVGALGFSGDEADGGGGRGVDGMRKGTGAKSASMVLVRSWWAMERTFCSA